MGWLARIPGSTGLSYPSALPGRMFGGVSDEYNRQNDSGRDDSVDLDRLYEFLP